MTELRFEEAEPVIPDMLPTARALRAVSGDETVARLSFERADDIAGASGPLGIVGNYHSDDSSAGTALLKEACSRLAALGVREVVGPMNGGTWGRYRLLLPDPELVEPVFVSEPWNRPQDFEQFRAAGFAPVSFYESRIVDDPAIPRPGAERLAARITRAGITLREMPIGQFESGLASLWEFSSAAFAGNPYYRPISLPDFLHLYAPLSRILDPKLALLAHDRAGRLAGFILAFPDLKPGTPPKGPPPARLVLKTLACAPDYRRIGLGACLADRLHAAAAAGGYRQVIHALMHVDNDSMRLSHRYNSRLFRRYALFGRQLRSHSDV